MTPGRRTNGKHLSPTAWIDARGAQGQQIGDYNTQINYLPAVPVSWPVRVGPVPSLADCYQTRVETGVLERAVAPGGAVVMTQVLSGLGGVGKSQLAAAYARAHATGFEFVMWVSATSRQAIVAGYGQAATQLGHRSPTGAAEDAAGWFRSWLQTTDRAWLVVLDDLVDPADLAGLWPDGPCGSTVVTTRRADAALFGHGRRHITVGVFTPDEARGYLAAKLGLGWASGEIGEADELARELEYLPLALAQAATFMLDHEPGFRSSWSHE